VSVDRAQYRDGERVAEVPEHSGMAKAYRDCDEIPAEGVTDVVSTVDAATLRVVL
jgi:hypothetical protein